jgi:hypothetical protein
MSAAELSTFLVTFLCVLVGWTAFRSTRGDFRANSLLASVATVFLTGMILFFIRQRPSVFLPDQIVRNFLARPMPTLLAGICGFAAASPWCFMMAEPGPVTLRRAGIWISGLGALTVGISAFLYDELSDLKVIEAKCFVSGFDIEEIATFDVAPIRVAADEIGNVFVSYYTNDIDGHFDGGIYQVAIDPSTRRAERPRLVASSTVLYRPFGIAVREGSIYVNRSGVFTAAKNGRQSHPNLGAVTRLSDLDQDGLFEHYHDVITDLPGARGPDPQHQNNGIAFDPAGNLFLAIGTNDDRSLDDHPWGATVLKASADFQTIHVFAKGLRNPFGLAIGPDDSVFVTDNDVRSNAGDEINHVREGMHFGHPWAVGKSGAGTTSSGSTGFADAIYLASPESNLCGIAYSGSDAFPETCRNCLFVASRPDDEILMMRLAKQGTTWTVAETVRFAKVLTPVELFVLSRVYKKLYRIRAA